MAELVEIHGEQWDIADIQDNVEWARQQDWFLKKYDNLNDHEHCLICYWAILASDNAEDSTGYFYGGSTWLCDECYTKFVKEYNK